MIRFHSHRKRKSYVLAIFIILLAVLLSVASPLYLRSLVNNIVYPFQFATASVWKGVTGIPSFFVHLFTLSKENTKFRRELDGIKLKIMLFDELVKENERLRNALAFKQNGSQSLRLLAGQVIARGPTPWYSILEINQGSRAGVKLDAAVIVKEGLVGRVVEVSLYSSKVMLLIDAESSVAAADLRSRDFGVVEGKHLGTLLMKYVSAGADIKVGDTVVASHISTIFPPGIPIGTVVHASKAETDLFYNIEVKPSVDFSKIEEVFIVI